MSECGKKVRLLRVLGGVNHRALVVAFDHALVLGPIHGTENPLAQICHFAEAQVDALLLNLGLIRQFANTRLPRLLPSIIARIDWTSMWSAASNNGHGDLHTRMAVELGADAIKTDYSGDPASMRSVVDDCPISMLVLGGSRQASDAGALEVVRGAVAAGAAGVFFGRNIFQAPNMGSFLQQARAILQGVEVPQTRR